MSNPGPVPVPTRTTEEGVLQEAVKTRQTQVLNKTGGLFQPSG